MEAAAPEPLELCRQTAPELVERGFQLERVIELARSRLGYDVVAVLEATAGTAVCRAAAGDADAFGIRVGEPWLAPEKWLRRAVEATRATVVQDAAQRRTGGGGGTAQREGTAQRGGTAQRAEKGSARVMAFVGVPLRSSDGSPCGTLCCLSREADPGLGQRDVGFITMLGELVVDELDALRRNESVRAALLDLVEAERVQIAYQPIYDLRTNQCVGVEALARFPEPFERPDRTFATGARVGLGLQLEELVVRRAWSVLADLQPGQYLALNLTPASLLALARRAKLRRTVDLSSLVVEITEHEAIDAYTVLRDELAELRRRGLRVAVDDAGSGYASLRHVLELRPDIVKVDKYLVDGIADDCGRRAAVGSFVSLARDLGATIVAEGVERAADLEAARELGMHGAQGYFLGRPSTDPSDLSAWLAAPPARALARGVRRSRQRITA